MGREARANQVTSESGIPFQFVVPIAKVDKEQRLVTGIVTQEILDKQGDIVDYETAKKFFTDDTLWPGNMREMHQPKAVGKKVAVECDDANKTITLTSRVSKGAPDTWEKILDGTLAFYSIGGNGDRVTEKQAGGGTAKRLFLKQLAETSYVDNGACPTAKFEIVKTVDGALVDAEAPDPEEIVDPVTKATAALDDAVEKAKGDKADEKDDEKHKTASGEEGKEYAGTDGKSFPIAEPKDVANAARALGRTDQDRAKVKANIIRIAYKLGKDYVAELPEAWKKKDDQKAVTGDTVRKDGMEPWDIERALTLICLLEQLVSSEMWEARVAAAAGDAAGAEVEQVKLLKQATDLVLQFLMSEWEEQFDAKTPTEAGPMAIPPLDLGDDLVVEMFVKSLAVIQKAGARHSKSDIEMIQKVHDLSGSLGATCKAMEDDDAEKVLKFVAGEKVAAILKDAGYLSPEKTTLLVSEPSEAITKITADLETLKSDHTALKAIVSEKDKTIASQEDRIKQLETQPATGGPLRSGIVIDKAIGGPQATTGEAATDEVCKVLDELHAKATTEEERTRIAAKKLDFRRTQGLDRVDPITGRPLTAV